MIKVSTAARAGVLGNPSDGFYGKTLSIPILNFSADVFISEWHKIKVEPTSSDKIEYDSAEELLNDLEYNGFYGGFRIIKSAIKQFFDYVKKKKIPISQKKFLMKYQSNIPRQKGLAGSSAIITSTMKCLCKFFGVQIENPQLANLVLQCETKELGISAGLQDRVVQVYNCPVYMDFSKTIMEKQGYGDYKAVNGDSFKDINLFLAYQTKITHESCVHNEIKKRWLNGEKLIIDTMKKIAANCERGYLALVKGDVKTFNECIDINFNLRKSIYNINKSNIIMIELARKVGATSKFSGGGGAIFGTYKDDGMLKELKEKFSEIGCEVVKIQKLK